MSGAPDQTVQILLKTVADLKDGELTIRQQRELQKAIEATGRGAELTMRQTRALEQAAARVQTQRSQAADEAARKSPPPIIPPEEDKKHGSKAMIRHFGAVAGQALGMPGLGMLAAAGGMAAGIGVTISLLEKGVRLLGQWNDKIQQFVAHGRSFETFELRVDSLSLRMQALRQHNQEVAQSMSFITREVNSVAAAVAQHSDLLQTQLAFEQRLDDARTRFTLSRVRLANLFNPLERIRQESEAEEAAYRRRLDRERQAERNKIAELTLQQRLAEQRQAIAEAEVNMAQATLPQKEHQADLAADELANTVKQTEARHEQLEEERKFVKQMADGSLVPGFGLKGYMAARAGMIGTDGFSGLDKTIASTGQTGVVGLGLGSVPSGIQEAAKRRLAEIDKETQGLADKRNVAKAKARAMAAEVNILTKGQSFSEEEARASEKSRQEAERDLEQQRRKMGLNESLRSQEENATRDAMRNEMRLQQLQTLPPANLAPTGGGAAIGDNELLEILKQIATNTEEAARATRPV